MPSPSFGESLTTALADIAASDERLIADCRSAWNAIHGVLESAAVAIDEISPTTPEPRLVAIETLLGRQAQRFLFEPCSALAAGRPLDRVLHAFERHRQESEDILRRAPVSVTASSTEITDEFADSGVSSIALSLFRWRWEKRAIPFRALLERRLGDRSAARLNCDGQFVLLLSQAVLHMIEPWQDLRRGTLGALGGEPAAAHALEEARERWTSRTAGLNRTAAEIAGRYERWKNNPISLVSSFRIAGPGADADFRQQCFRYWSRQQRAVLEVPKLEMDLAGAVQDAILSAKESLHSLDDERRSLLGELSSVIGWLKEWQAGEKMRPFPPATTNLVPAPERSGQWQRAIESLAERRLPSRIETVHPTSALPPRRPPWRVQRPERAFLEAFHQYGLPAVLEAFREAASAHQAIVREIERAREVVGYSLEVASSDPESGREIAEEGVANALSLCSYQQRSIADPHPLMERRLVEAIAATAQAAHSGLERGRVGLLAELARRTASDALRQAGSQVMQRSAWAGHRMVVEAGRGYHWVLLKIGWETPPDAIAAPVMARGYLGDLLNLQRSHRELPVIYRRLFRLAPVEDPRFLVGRQPEMAALIDAKALWEAGRAVSVIVVGARGSGKTSLLNCAAAGPFQQSSVIRSQFRGRITDSAGLHSFLARLLGLRDEKELPAAFAAEKRVIVLEELERTFLRSMNGFGGIRELLHIISGTSASTLWILTVNQHSYRYLDAAVRLGEFFSHRINAMAVAPEHLKSAILMRHNFSGLRLEYPPAPRTDPRLSGIQRLFGLQREPADFFFDSLYGHCEGIFRGAFELWQHYVERVEGGVLHLRSPAEPNYEPLISGLVLEDVFSLQAVLQHGVLTEAEHAAIFECHLDESRARIERLLGLELLEAEPESIGFRVRPEAQRIVHIALHRLNLI